MFVSDAVIDRKKSWSELYGDWNTTLLFRRLVINLDKIAMRFNQPQNSRLNRGTELDSLTAVLLHFTYLFILS